MNEYLARYIDENDPRRVRHVVIVAADAKKAMKYARARLRTISWKGCKLEWVKELNCGLGNHTYVGAKIG